MPVQQSPFNGKYFYFDQGDGTLENPYRNTNIPYYSSVVNMSLTTSATGSNYVTFSSQTCKELELYNTTSVDVEFQRTGSGVAIPIPSGTSLTIRGITNANQIGIRRVDTTNDQITVFAEASS